MTIHPPHPILPLLERYVAHLALTDPERALRLDAMMCVWACSMIEASWEPPATTPPTPDRK